MPVFVPHSLEETFEALRQEPEADLLAGGTDFMVEVNAGHRKPRAVIALQGVEELAGWHREGDEVVLGASTTYTEMMRPELGALLPGLAQAARTVGSPQIRNSGTIGGNLATASPAGDTLPVLAALEATIVVSSAPGESRRIRLDELIEGPKRTSLRPGDLITSVRLPARQGSQEFLKVGTRNAMIIAVASVACVVDFAVRTVRLALGSVGPVVIRATQGEDFIASRIDWEARNLPTPEADLAELVALVRAAASPIDDHRSTAAYRRHAVGICAGRAVARALSPAYEAGSGIDPSGAP
ncbi:MAG: FAD binding domain-containing protein [Acidimicrobiales bacterium]